MCLDGSLSKHYYVIEREKRVTVSKRYADLFALCYPLSGLYLTRSS